jgi:proteic killer suppression protein
LEVFYLTGSMRGITVSHAAKLARVLAALDAAAIPVEFDLPSFRLLPLKGWWSILVNGNWRIIFRFVGTDVELVDYLDYH